MQTEKYLGGYESPNLWKREQLLTFGKPRGYAIHVTDKRIFGIMTKKERFKATAFEIMVGAAFGTPYGKEETVKAITELEHERELEIPKESVSAIRMKKPSSILRTLFGLGYGYLQIQSPSGVMLNIYTQYPKDFDALRRLMESFKPDVLQVV